MVRVLKTQTVQSIGYILFYRRNTSSWNEKSTQHLYCVLHQIHIQLFKLAQTMPNCHSQKTRGRRTEKHPKNRLSFCQIWSNHISPFRYSKSPENQGFPGFLNHFDIVWAVDYRLCNWEGLILLGSWNVVLQTRYKRRTTHYSSEHLWIIKEGDGLNKYVSPSFLSQHHSIPVVFENVYVLFWYIHLFLK